MKKIVSRYISLLQIYFVTVFNVNFAQSIHNPHHWSSNQTVYSDFTLRWLLFEIIKALKLIKSIQTVNSWSKCNYKIGFVLIPMLGWSSPFHGYNSVPIIGQISWSDCTPPPPFTQTGTLALYFRTDLSKYHLNFNFHCISAPTHLGKGLDPTKRSKCPFELGQFVSK